MNTPDSSEVEAIRNIVQGIGYMADGQPPTIGDDRAIVAIQKLLVKARRQELALLEDPSIRVIIRNKGLTHWVRIRMAELTDIKLDSK